MMLPNTAYPVHRPNCYSASYRLVQTGVERDADDNPIIDRETGQPIPILLWRLIKGAIAEPNAPQEFLQILPPSDACYLFSGFSRRACLGR
jgi:hypothetical protein